MTQQLENLKVKSRNAADNKELIENIHTNLDLIDKWVKPCWEHGGKALLVSAGRFLKDHIENIRKAQKDGFDVYCVKHSYKTLVDNGIIPKACLILDPRPVNGYSTHGQQRKELYQNLTKDTLFFVASMTHPSTTEELLNNGGNVVGWHVAVTGLTEVLQERKVNAVLITDGTSSATRGVGLLKVMGYRHIELVAYGSDVDEPSPQQKRERNVEGPLKYQQVLDGDDVFWTTGELLAQVQDLQHLADLYAISPVHLSMWEENSLGCRAFKKKQQQKELEKKGGGFGEGNDTVNFEDLMKTFNNYCQLNLVVTGSDGKALTIADQNVIRLLLSHVGVPSWESVKPVVQ